MAEEKLELFEKTDDGEIRKRQQVFARFFLDTPSIKKLAEARKLLESYSHLEPEKVTDHVVAIVWVQEIQQAQIGTR